MKNKFESMRKKNFNNAANNILSNGKHNSAAKAHQMRTKSVDDELPERESAPRMVSFMSVSLYSFQL